MLEESSNGSVQLIKESSLVQEHRNLSNPFYWTNYESYLIHSALITLSMCLPVKEVYSSNYCLFDFDYVQ